MPGFARKDRPGMLRQCHRAESHFSQLLEGQGRPHHYLNRGDGGAEIRWGNFLPKLPRCHNFANFTGRQLGFANVKDLDTTNTPGFPSGSYGTVVRQRNTSLSPVKMMLLKWSCWLLLQRLATRERDLA